MRHAPALSALTALLLAMAAYAQPEPVPEPAPQPKVTSTFGRTGEELDRFELGVGAVQGFFDIVGSVGYRRFIGERDPLERSIMVELTGSAKSHLTEGVASAYLLLRPMASYRQAWRIRPLIEIGPGGHVVFQTVSIEGFDRRSYHAKAYLKTHAYAGFEALVTNRIGFLVRGRMSAPSHHPFDYAQAAIFLR